MITLVPIGGLCNRMRAIASGVYVSKALGIPLEVVWKKNNDCYANFDDLFCLPLTDDFTVRPFTPADFYLSYSKKSNLFIPGFLRHFIFDFQYVGEAERLDDRLSFFGDLSQSGFLSQSGDTGFNDVVNASDESKLSTNLSDIDESGKTKVSVDLKKIFIISGYSFAKHYPVVNLFKPLPELMDRINSVTGDFGMNTVGVHIRRGDNLLAIAKNSVDDFFKKMDALIAIDNSTKFYLATDSEEVRNSAILHFGNRLLHNNSELSRKTVKGMKDAVVDLWNLAGSKELLGSYNSSFSDMAVSLKGCHPLRET